MLIARKPPLDVWRTSTLVVLSVWILGCGNRDELVVWKAELLSPDGFWLATADTVQNGEFGTREIHTTVFLRRAQVKAAPQEVLVVECDGPIPHPYVLDNIANKGGCVGLTMAWATPRQLHLTYEMRWATQVVFQVVSCLTLILPLNP
jgi:hypothetical protein